MVCILRFAVIQLQNYAVQKHDVSGDESEGESLNADRILFLFSERTVERLIVGEMPVDLERKVVIFKIRTFFLFAEI